MKSEIISLRRDIRMLIVFFITVLVLSGITAFPVETELSWLLSVTGQGDHWMRQWLSLVYQAVKHTNETYPFLAYGYDWLAFAHLVIAVVFAGPLLDPVRNSWVIKSGMIACLMILPFAFIAGSIRNIPFAWQLIDCSFGVIGFIPLYICYRKIKALEIRTGGWSPRSSGIQHHANSRADIRFT